MKIILFLFVITICFACQQKMVEEQLPKEKIEVSEEITFEIKDKNFNRIFEIGEELQFTLGYSASLGENYLWHFGTGDTSTVRNPIYTFKEEGKYLITLIIDNAVKVEEKIEVIGLIQANIFDSIFTIQATHEAFVGEEVIFKANATGIEKWSWEFGDGMGEIYEEDTPQIMHVFKKSGKYQVSVITNISEDFPVYHNIVIHSKFEAAKEEEPVDSLKLAGDDLRIRLQKIADAGVRDNITFKKEIKEIEKLYFCDPDKIVGVRVNGNDVIDFDTFCHKIHHSESGEDESVQILEVVVEKIKCIRIINVVQVSQVL